MTHSKIVELLRGAFIPRKEGLEGVCFPNDYMDSDNEEKYAIYEAISEAQRESDLTFDFSYQVAEKAVDILENCEDFDKIEDIDIDSVLPIYTADIMEIYKNNSWIVDEACEELGSGAEDSQSRALTGWYIAIDRMVRSIGQNLANCYEFEV